jgi:hypothetical protein
MKKRKTWPKALNGKANKRKTSIDLKKTLAMWKLWA